MTAVTPKPQNPIRCYNIRANYSAWLYKLKFELLICRVAVVLPPHLTHFTPLRPDFQIARADSPSLENSCSCCLVREPCVETSSSDARVSTLPAMSLKTYLTAQFAALPESFNRLVASPPFLEWDFVGVLWRRLATGILALLSRLLSPDAWTDLLSY